MNEKNFEIEQSPYGAYRNPQKTGGDGDKFTWFKDPNFKIDDDSSDEEEKKQQINTDEENKDPLTVPTEEGMIQNDGKMKSMRLLLPKINDNADMENLPLSSKDFQRSFKENETQKMINN